MSELRPSLFRRATASSPHFEDRLTEALAAVLERVPDAAVALARAWSHSSAKAGEVPSSQTTPLHDALCGARLISVRTQVELASRRRRIDLELRFLTRDEPPASIVLWTEVKLGSEPHTRQVYEYSRLMPETDFSAVVVLAPRSSLPFSPDDVPSSVPQRTWQSVAGVLRTIEHSSNSDIERFLLRELCDFMQEHGLIDPPVIRPEHLVALAHRRDTEVALERLCEQVSTIVESHRHWHFSNRYLRHGKPHFGVGYWEAHFPTDASSAWLDWNVPENTSSEDAPSGAVYFLSGLCAQTEADLWTWPDFAVRRERLLDGVEIDGREVRLEEIRDKHHVRLARVAWPEEVLIGRTLESQGSALGRWILDGFDALTRPVDDLVSPA